MAAVLDLGLVFDASPNPYMVLDRELRYVAVNRAYLAATSRRREELIGRGLIELFPHDPNDPGNENSLRLVQSLRRVLATGRPDVLPFIHYRILVTGPEGARYEDRYWSATHTPLPGGDGTVEFVLQHTVDVTEMYRASRAAGQPPGPPAAALVEAGVFGRAQLVQQRNELLDQDLRRLLRIFDQSPGFLSYLSGPEHVYELANAAYSQLVGGRSLLGKTVREALPEVDQAYHDLLDRVYAGGEPFVGWAMPVRLQRTPDGPVEEAFVDFVYQPITDSQGRTAGILVMGQDITEHKRGQREREGLRHAAESVQAELEAIFESFPEALFVGDASGIKRANAAARDILGYESVDQVLRGQSTLVRELDARRADTGVPLPPDQTVYAQALRGTPSRMEVVISDWKTGRPRHIFSSGAPIRQGDHIAGAVVAMLDISELKRAQTEALQLARVLDDTRDFVGI
jgi:PAS domain S-box-containing protein